MGEGNTKKMGNNMGAVKLLSSGRGNGAFVFPVFN